MLGGMSDNFTDFSTEPRVRRAMQVSYSVEIVADIAAGYDEMVDREEWLAARCMLDAFYVHIRLLADFLTRPTKSIGFGPTDFGGGWTAPAGAASDRLAAAWEVASKYVVHFGHPRVPDDVRTLTNFEVSGTAFRDLAMYALDLFAAFVRGPCGVAQARVV